MNASGVAKKVDIRCEPASMITEERNSSQSIYHTGTRQHIAQFPQMVGRFVIPTDDDSQDRCGGLARIIPLEEKS